MPVATPRFLQALDNVDPCDDGTYIAECPICRDLLLIEPLVGSWRLTCDSGCTHDELVRWIAITDLRTSPGEADRMWVALMLATTPETWAGLLAGEPVHRAALDPQYVCQFRGIVS